MSRSLNSFCISGTIFIHKIFQQLHPHYTIALLFHFHSFTTTTTILNCHQKHHVNRFEVFVAVIKCSKAIQINKINDFNPLYHLLYLFYLCFFHIYVGTLWTICSSNNNGDRMYWWCECTYSAQVNVCGSGRDCNPL